MMLDYINTHFMTFTYWVAAGIEVSGVMHSSYLISIIVHQLAGKPVESNEPPKTGFTFVFFWGRVLFSCGVLCFGLAVTIDALYRGKTSAWDGLPETVSLVLFFVLMSCVGLLEGMQIAFFAVSKLPKSERGTSPMALRTCECLFKNGGKNLPGFMCGRQMTVTLCFFIIARVTTINVKIGEEDNIFGVSDPIQKMFNLGFMGALVTTILGSITWQLVAGAFPIAFLSNPLVFVFLQAALFLEATGICSAAWFLAVLQRKALGFQFDEVYIGTPEERAAKGHADAVDAGHDQVHLTTYIAATGVGTDNLTEKFRPLSVMQETYSGRREKILSNIKEIRSQISQSTYEGEKVAFEQALKLEIDALSKLNGDEMKSKRGFEDMGAIEEDV
jgi:hypothetical protein